MKKKPQTEAEKLERAAQMAFDAGDLDHWHDLERRALAAKRKDREHAAGVS